MEKSYRKIEQGIFSIAKDLLGSQVGENLDTVTSYSEKLSLSLGTVQKALTLLCDKEIITLKKKGKMGSEIESIDYTKLFHLLSLQYLLCVMPTTYSVRYRKIMEYMEESLKIPVPLYFAHMRGGEIRTKLIAEGVYNLGIVSKLAALSAIKDGMELEIVKELGPQSYVTKHVILKRQGEVRRVGRDQESSDHFFLTNLNFQKNENIEIVNISYSQVIEKLLEGTIDAAIWNYDDVLDKMVHLKNHDIVVEELEANPFNDLATESVVVIKKGDTVMENIFYQFFRGKEWI